MSTVTFSESEYLEHTTRDGDRWDLLALDYYGDATLYEPILRANSSLLPEPYFPPPAHILDPGLVLKIPLITSSTPGPALEDNLRPPWRVR